MKLSITETNALVHFASFYNDRVMPDKASYLNAASRQAASRLVKKGLFERVTGPMGSGYRITDAGRSHAAEFLGAFIVAAVGRNSRSITATSDLT